MMTNVQYKVKVKSECQSGSSDYTDWLFFTIDAFGNASINIEATAIDQHGRDLRKRVDGDRHEIIMKMFPNPTSQFVHLELSTENAKVQTIQINDFMGYLPYPTSTNLDILI